MQIKIVRKPILRMWYSDRQGEVFNVEYVTEQGYWCREGGTWNCLNVVNKDDAEVYNTEN